MRKTSFCLTEDLVGLAKLAVLTFQRVEPIGKVGRHTGVLAAIDLGLLHPLQQSVRRTADLLGSRCDGCPARRMISFVIRIHPVKAAA